MLFLLLLLLIPLLPLVLVFARPAVLDRTPKSDAVAAVAVAAAAAAGAGAAEGAAVEGPEALSLAVTASSAFIDKQRIQVE